MTVKKNKQGFSSRQIKGAKRAIKLLHALGCPTVNDLKAIIRMNLIMNNPVTTEDINLAEIVYGKDIPSMKGKTTRRKPSSVKDNTVELPPELIRLKFGLTLAIDIMTVNGCKFLTTISNDLYYRTAHYIKNKEYKTLAEAILKTLKLYEKRDFKITRIKADNEFQKTFQYMSQHYSYNGMIIFSNPQEHTPEAERNIRTIKERCRATYHSLPYPRLTKNLVIYMVLLSTSKLN